MPKRIETDDAALIDAYSGDETLTEIGSRFGINRCTVASRLRAAGVPLKPAHPRQRQVVGSDGKRPCHACKKRLKPEAFHKNKRRPDGLSPSCRKCWAVYRNIWWLKNEFGLTLEEYDEILARQNNGCGICGTKLGMLRKGKRLRLCVDHCHETGAVRGILCCNCNNGLGRFKDDPVLLANAIEYLKR